MAKIEAAKNTVTQGCPEAEKLLMIAVKTKIGLAVVFHVNMEMMAAMSDEDRAKMAGIAETLGEDMTKALCKLRTQWVQISTSV